jgi:cobalt/nickel transport system ATP-binding protein
MLDGFFSIAFIGGHSGKVVELMDLKILELKDVSVAYDAGEDPVLKAATFSLCKGEHAALLGLNGSGKTTLLMAAAGLVPHEGEIKICGMAVTRKNLPEIRDKIGFLFNVPEDQLLFPKVLDDAAFGLLRRGMNRRDAEGKAISMLERLGVAHLAQTPVHHLSHGQKQRVALAGALVTNPPLLLLDEPSAGLDPPGRRDLAAILKSLDSAMLVATHDAAFSGAFCTRQLVIEGGGIQVGTGRIAGFE